MTNKGQSLVIFVLLLPVIFLLITLVWELGNLSYTTAKYESEIKNTIEYGLNNIEDPNVETKLKALLDNIDGQTTLAIADGTIKINLKVEYKTIYKMIFKDKLDIDVTYTGYKENEKIIIKKE